MQDQPLARMLPICLTLPGAVETVQLRRLACRVRGRMFAVLEGWKGEPCLVVKVGKPALSLFLADPRSFQAPYIGKHGWVSLRRDAAQDWEEIGELVRASHELVSGKPKRG